MIANASQPWFIHTWAEDLEPTDGLFCNIGGPLRAQNVDPDAL